MKLKFAEGEKAVILPNSTIGKPNHAGEIVEIIKQNRSKYYDYDVRLPNSNIVRVKESELMEIKEQKSGSVEDMPLDMPLNIALHKKILKEIHTTYLQKNADYGSSFEEQYKEYGNVSSAIRLDDKIRRFKQLINNEAKVKGETIRDTLTDLANYAIMTVMELDKKENKQTTKVEHL